MKVRFSADDIARSRQLPLLMKRQKFLESILDDLIENRTPNSSTLDGIRECDEQLRGSGLTEEQADVARFATEYYADRDANHQD